MRNILWMLLLCVAVASAQTGTGYRLVHPDGTVEFSDTPIPGGETIKIREAPTIKFAPQDPSPRNGTKAVEQADRGDVIPVAIVSPRQDQTVWFDEAGLTVVVSVTPALDSGQKIVITLDGQEVGSGRESRFLLKGLFRGSHTLGATVISESGRVISSSEPITIHVRQHSLFERQPVRPGLEPLPPE